MATTKQLSLWQGKFLAVFVLATMNMGLALLLNYEVALFFGVKKGISVFAIVAANALAVYAFMHLYFSDRPRKANTLGWFCLIASPLFWTYLLLKAQYM
ncbi:hypothetical protein H8593_004283 [Salmonella enterica subsp. enterica serovar Give]|nr:hypothetical protein [Salmonella enterica subsp. enterica serovar Give]